MRVYNAEPYGYSVKAIDKWKNKGFAYREGSWEEINAATLFEGVTILIVRLKQKVDAKVLDKFPDLTHVVSATTGHDHLDEEAMVQRNVQLVSLRPHTSFLKTIPSTAEHTWALIMALLRNIPAATQDVLNGKWNRDPFRGFQIKDKTIGIIGMGRTGQKVSSYAEAFDAQVVFYDPYVDTYPGANKLDLDTLLETADIISMHVHLNEETEYMIGEKEISQMKNGVFLINTSRGKVWNEEAISKALGDKVAGLATDVIGSELENFQKSPLWRAATNGENVIITPHIGGATWDAMQSCEEFMAVNFGRLNKNLDKT